MKLLDLNDRFARGLVAGLAATLVKDSLNLIVYGFGLVRFRYLDFFSILIHGRRPVNLQETLFAQVGEIMFSAVMGAVLAYILTAVNSRNYIIKGWVFGTGLWFVSYVMTLLYKVPGLLIIPFNTAFANFVGSSIYGILTVLILRWLDERVAVESPERRSRRVIFSISPAPARKRGAAEKGKIKTPKKIKLHRHW